MARPMKDSGVDWIGLVPKDWSVLRTKNIFRNHKDVVGERESEFERLALTLNGVIKRSKTDSNGLQPEKFDGYQIVHSNELIFKLIDLANVATSRVGLSPYEGIVSPAYIILYSHKDCCIKFAEYYFKSLWQREVFNHIGDEGVRSSLSADTLLNIPYVAPSVKEQKAIVSVLDKKCAAIDDVLTKTQESIEEYKKLKQAVITESVTKGVRGKRPMKDSGVNWIGQIPKDWNVDKLKRILTERNESNDPVQTSERLSLSIDTGVTLYAEKTTNLDRFKEDVSQYKLAHIGDLVMNSMNVIVGAVGVSDYFGCVSPAYYTYYDNEADHITARYMDYVFRTKSLRALLYRLGKGIYAIDRGDGKVNTCRLKVSREDMRSLLLPLPSVEEQREIVSYLDKKCEDIEALIAKKQQFIDELTAYKKSLIYEYVTGKKEVPV